MRLATLICSLLTAAVAAAGWSPAPMGRWDMPDDHGAAVRVSVEDGLVLVVTDDTAPNNNPGGWFWTIDVSNPHAPTGAGDLELTGVPSAVARHGDLVAVAWYHVRTNRGAVELIDVSNPAGPVSIAEINVFGAPTALAWAPPYLLTAVRETGAGMPNHVLVTYAAIPSTPVFAGTKLVPYATTAMDLEGDSLCLAGEGDGVAELEWLDVSDPLNIRVEDSYGGNQLFTSLDAVDDRVHVLRPDGVYILIDLSLGDFMVFRSSVGLPAPATGLARHGDVLYTAGGDLNVIDATDPDAAFIAGSYAAGTAVDVAVTDQYAVMLDAGGFWTMPLYAVPTPIAVADFTATAKDGTVVLYWRAEQATAADFRLVGSAGGRTWTLDIAGDGSGDFSADDATAFAGEVTYTLSLNNGERWSLVGEATVHLSPPVATVLHDPYPNPFNPRVTVPFSLALPGAVRVTVHDVRGRRVAVLLDASLSAGRHQIVWDGMDTTGAAAPSGTYHLRLDVEGETTSRTATLIR